MKTIIVLASILVSNVAFATPPTIGEECVDTPVTLPCPPGNWKLKVTMTDGSTCYAKCSAPIPMGYYDRTVYGSVGVSLAFILNDVGPGFSPEVTGTLAVPIGSSDFDWLLSASFGGASGVMTGSVKTGLGYLLNPNLRLSFMGELAGEGDGDSQNMLGGGPNLGFDWAFSRGEDVSWTFGLQASGGPAILNDAADGQARNDAWYFRTMAAALATF
jgi:hypothetical protein